jgi:hypothetical protein
LVVSKLPFRIINKSGFQQKNKLIVKVYFPIAEKLGKRLFLHVLSVPLNRDMTRRGDIISGE